MRSINIYQDLADLVASFVLAVPDLFLEFDEDQLDIYLLEPEADEVLRFEVVYDNGQDEDVLVVAEGEIDHEFNFNLRLLEE